MGTSQEHLTPEINHKRISRQERTKVEKNIIEIQKIRKYTRV